MVISHGFLYVFQRVSKYYGVDFTKVHPHDHPHSQQKLSVSLIRKTFQHPR